MSLLWGTLTRRLICNAWPFELYASQHEFAQTVINTTSVSHKVPIWWISKSCVNVFRLITLRDEVLDWWGRLGVCINSNFFPICISAKTRNKWWPDTHFELIKSPNVKGQEKISHKRTVNSPSICSTSVIIIFCLSNWNLCLVCGNWKCIIY